MKKEIVMLLCFSLVFSQVFAGGTKEETGEIIGTTVGAVGGGAATGALIGSIFPGVGTVIGGVIGGALGGWGIGSLGGTIGGAIGRALTYDGSEFINVKTTFDYVQLGSERIENIVYKTDGNEQSALFSNDFIYGNDVVMTISMSPEIIDEKADIPNTGLDIPVYIFIETSESVSYERYGGLADVYEEVDEEGNTFFYTIIKSTAKDATLSFRFSASAPGEAKATIIFGTFEDRLIVTQNSNQTRTIRFIEY